MAYTPVEKYCGDLPEVGGNSIVYKLADSNISEEVKEVLVYIWATTKGDAAFERYYYQIQTTDGKQLYNQFMNVAASKDVSLNSANIWLPIFKGHAEVTVTLIGPEGSSAKGKRISYRCSADPKLGGGDNTHSQFFFLGYRK